MSAPERMTSITEPVGLNLTANVVLMTGIDAVGLYRTTQDNLKTKKQGHPE